MMEVVEKEKIQWRSNVTKRSAKDHYSAVLGPKKRIFVDLQTRANSRSSTSCQIFPVTADDCRTTPVTIDTIYCLLFSSALCLNFHLSHC